MGHPTVLPQCCADLNLGACFPGPGALAVRSRRAPSAGPRLPHVRQSKCTAFGCTVCGEVPRSARKDLSGVKRKQTRI